MNGFCFFGNLSNKLFWEVQVLSRIRKFKDGITFIKINLNYDNYEAEHNPCFTFELTVFNIYNHFIIFSKTKEL